MTYKRVDANQRLIVAALRQAGATVQHLHMVGHGCPDVLCGISGRNVLLEIKHGHGRLTKDEREWHECWRGEVYVVYTVDDALKAIGVLEAS